MAKMHLTVVILTLNEEKHISRAISSVNEVSDRIVVVDSGSTDDTADIARRMGAEILTHPFTTQAKQFNWALEQLPNDTDWILRLDADEIVSRELTTSLAQVLPTLGPDISGARVNRRIAFMGRPIQWGGVFPVSITRILRHGHGRSEDRWMDEHILLDGAEVQLDGEILDSNLKPLSWWIDKHNNYSSREVVEILNSEHKFLTRDHNLVPSGKAGSKRILKEKVYAQLPTGIRALLYFVYRYVLRGGFLDGAEGTAFHVLQGFWYRYLVDTKLFEVRQYMQYRNVDATTAIRDILGIDLNP